jgi:integrase
MRKGYYIVSDEQILLHKQLNSLPKVESFLSSVQRSSMRTKVSYETGLTHFHSFLMKEHDHTIDSIIQPLLDNKFNVYNLLEEFITYMITKVPSASPATLKSYMTAIRSYLAYYDIDVIPSKFKRKVRMPRVSIEDKEALDVNDIRNILINCNNRRLKTFILVLASGGMRVGEAIGIRLTDIDFSTHPTKVHIRKEFSKTRVARDIYISDEATKFVKDWIKWKYKKVNGRSEDAEDLIFQVLKKVIKPKNLYVKIVRDFQLLLSSMKLDARQEGMIRRKVTLHSFRRFVKTVISNQFSQDYSEWFLGHSKSTYYTIKESEKREIYLTICMKYLTFLDYTTLESTGRNIEAKLEEKDRQIQLMKQHYENEMKETRQITQQRDVEIESKYNKRIEELEKQLSIIAYSLSSLTPNSRDEIAKQLFQNGIYRLKK